MIRELMKRGTYFDGPATTMSCAHELSYQVVLAAGWDEFRRLA